MRLEKDASYIRTWISFRRFGISRLVLSRLLIRLETCLDSCPRFVFPVVFVVSVVRIIPFIILHVEEYDCSKSSESSAHDRSDHKLA